MLWYWGILFYFESVWIIVNQRKNNNIFTGLNVLFKALNSLLTGLTELWFYIAWFEKFYYQYSKCLGTCKSCHESVLFSFCFGHQVVQLLSNWFSLTLIISHLQIAYFCPDNNSIIFKLRRWINITEKCTEQKWQPYI